MANTLRFKRGLVSGIPTAALGEPLFTTDTFDLYIGNGTTNTRFQKYIASGTTSQLLRGDGSLLTMPIVLTSPSNGQVLKYNGTSWVNDSDSGITGSGSAGQVAYFTGATTQTGSNNLFWDDANIRLGVGRTPSARRFEIQQAIGSVAASIGLYSGGGSLRSIIGIESVSTDDLQIASVTGLRFYSGSTLGNIVTNPTNERMRLTANGRLLLGTTTEGTQLLQVNGTSLFSDNLRVQKDFIGTTSILVGNLGTINAATIMQFGLSEDGSTVNGYFRRYRNGTALTEIGFSNALAFTGAVTGTPAERMRIDANGSVGIGTTSLTGVSLSVSKNITGAVASIGIVQAGQVQTDVTSVATGFRNVLNTAASTPLGDYYHIRLGQGTIGAGTTLTQQIGLYINDFANGTSRYGILSELSAGTGKWNLYMGGTADNYFAGNVGIGNATPSRPLVVNGDTTLAGNNYIGLTKIIQWEGAAYWGLRTASSGNSFEIFRGDTITTPFGISSSNNILVGSVATDTGEKLQVNGTMKVTGASTFGGTVTINATIITGVNPLNLNSYIKAASTGFLVNNNADTENNFGVLDNGNTRVYRGSLTIGSVVGTGTGALFAGAATFSSSVTAGGSITSTGILQNAISNSPYTNSAWVRGASGVGIFLVNEALTRWIGIKTDNTLDFQGEATFSSSIQAATAIAIGTTPDTNKPFKILKNINDTVGIRFENTSTGSLAFSALQMGTDVTGGTKFTNLVYASSGVTASGVYQPDGTSLINNGAGGLNFLGNPIRMYTGASNGTLRWDMTNDGFITQYSGTNPTTNATDGYRQYSADVVAGNAAPHFRTENGAIIKLYQETTAVGNSTISVGGGNAVLDDTEFGGYTLRQVVQALKNQGILA